MRPLTVTSTIDAPRERVFDYLADIANHAEFTEGLLEDFRLERLDSRGVGASARFRLRPPLLRAARLDLWAELVITELESPHRLVLDGRAGRIGRVDVRAVFELTRQDPGMTRVELTVSSEPVTIGDRLGEALGGRWWLRMRCGRALRELKLILERGEPSTRAVGVAAG